MAKMMFRTTYCRPVVDASGNQSSRVFKAGQVYDIEMTPEFKSLEERGYIYQADKPAPTEPPKMDPPIQSERTHAERDAIKEMIEETVAAVAVGMTPDQLEGAAKKRGWQRAAATAK